MAGAITIFPPGFLFSDPNLPSLTERRHPMKAQNDRGRPIFCGHYDGIPPLTQKTLGEQCLLARADSHTVQTSFSLSLKILNRQKEIHFYGHRTSMSHHAYLIYTLYENLYDVCIVYTWVQWSLCCDILIFVCLFPWKQLLYSPVLLVFRGPTIPSGRLGSSFPRK